MGVHTLLVGNIRISWGGFLDKMSFKLLFRLYQCMHLTVISLFWITMSLQRTCWSVSCRCHIWNKSCSLQYAMTATFKYIVNNTKSTFTLFFLLKCVPQWYIINYRISNTSISIKSGTRHRYMYQKRNSLF